MNPYNLDPRNMTAEERERAAYLAGDYATVELVAELADVQDDLLRVTEERDDAVSEIEKADERISTLESTVAELDEQVASLEVATGMIDE